MFYRLHGHRITGHSEALTISAQLLQNQNGYVMDLVVRFIFHLVDMTTGQNEAAVCHEWAEVSGIVPTESDLSLVPNMCNGFPA